MEFLERENLKNRDRGENLEFDSVFRLFETSSRATLELRAFK